MTHKQINDASTAWEHHMAMVLNQYWPKQCLYVVATPIGNLADFSLRAYEALRRCDAIAAEDTRTTRNLLNSWGLETSLMPAHRHNEHAAAAKIIESIQAGQTLALVSDAGAPAVSDPGSYIVQQVLAAGIRVVPIPGPSAVIAALMASGATSDENPSFTFAGFIPSKAKARIDWLSKWLALDHPVLMFETPHRIMSASKAIVSLVNKSRLITVARELSKRFEEINTMPAAELEQWLSADTKRQQGEFVLIVHAENIKDKPAEELGVADQKTMQILLAELSVRDAVRLGVKLTGVKRDLLYAWALANSGD